MTEWLNLAVTGGALGAAIYAGVQAGRLLKVELRRDREAEAAEESRQAVQVAAWAHSTPRALHGNANTEGSALIGVSGVAANRSDQPVYNVILTWRLTEPGRLPIEVSHAGVLPPGDQREWPLNQATVAGVLSRKPEELNERLSVPDAERQSRAAADRIRIELTFTDANGREWTRTEQGALVRGQTVDAS